jgi:hypothetical protein
MATPRLPTGRAGRTPRDEAARAEGRACRTRVNSHEASPHRVPDTLNLGPRIALVAGLIVVSLAIITVFYVEALHKDMDFTAHVRESAGCSPGLWSAKMAAADDDPPTEIAKASAELRRQALRLDAAGPRRWPVP